MQKRNLISLIAGAALSLALVACGSSSNNSGSQPAATAPAASATSGAPGTPASAVSPIARAAASPVAAAPSATLPAQNIKRGGTLNLATSLDAKVFDPMLTNDQYSGYVTSQVFEGLVVFDSSYKPMPNLADSWDISPDALTYTFHLHHGVKFQDGTDFNATAMKFSMDRIRSNKASVAYQDCGPDSVADTKVVDDFTFQVILTKPYAPFLTKLGGRCGAAVSPTAVQKLGDDKFGLAPVGTGPFKFGEWQQGDHFDVVKWDGYWKMGADGKPLPYLDKVNRQLIQDPNQQLQGLIAGDLDIASVADKDVDTVKSTPSLTFQQQPGLGWTGFMLNVSKPPFNNKNLAQAVAFAINPDEVNQTIFKGLRSLQLNGVIPSPLSWAVDPNYKPYPYNPDMAKARLAAGGQPNGFTFTIQADTSSPVTQQTLELYQSELKKVGITMNIQSGDFNSVVVKNGLAGDFEATAINISGGIDPDNWIYGTFHTGSQFNIPHLSDPQIDMLAEQGRAETDINKRAAIYQQANKLIMDYSPWIIVTNNPDRFTGNKRVQGWYLGSKATVGYSEYWKSAN